MVASKSRMFRTPSGKLVTTSDAQKAGVSTDVAKLTEDDIKKLAKAASDRLGMAVNTNTLRQDGVTNERKALPSFVNPKKLSSFDAKTQALEKQLNSLRAKSTYTPTLTSYQKSRSVDTALAATQKAKELEKTITDRKRIREKYIAGTHLLDGRKKTEKSKASTTQTKRKAALVNRKLEGAKAMTAGEYKKVPSDYKGTMIVNGERVRHYMMQPVFLTDKKETK